MEKEQTSMQYGSLECTKWNAETAKAAEEDVVSMADSTITVDDIEGELFKIERIRDILVRRESELRYTHSGSVEVCFCGHWTFYQYKGHLYCGRGGVHKYAVDKDSLLFCASSQLCPSEFLRHVEELLKCKSEVQGLVYRPSGRMDDIQLCKEITRLKKELQKLVSIPDKDKSKDDKQKEEELLQQIHKLVETRDFLVDDVEFERLREKEEDKEMAEFLQSKFPKSLNQKNPVQKLTSRAQQTSSPFVSKTGLTLLKECCGFTCSVM